MSRVGIPSETKGFNMIFEQPLELCVKFWEKFAVLLNCTRDFNETRIFYETIRTNEGTEVTNAAMEFPRKELRNTAKFWVEVLVTVGVRKRITANITA